MILSGGSGTRLWPMSRPEMPKQMLALTAEETMLQLTARRALGEALRRADRGRQCARMPTMVEEQLAAVGAAPQALILEPVGAQHRARDRARRACRRRRRAMRCW